MPKASNLTPDKNISMLLKGPFGFSKTCAATSACIEGPIYLAYWDKKSPVELEHFYRHIIKRPELLDNIEYDVYGAHNANLYLNKLIALSHDCRYVAVITDSVTMMTASAVNWSIGFRNPAGAKKDPLNKDASLMIPDWDEYKVETSLVTQALDICRTLPCHIIWTCHPLPSLKMEGTGGSMKVSKVNNIVSYGSKVGAIIPGQFTEIYHFTKSNDWDSKNAKSIERRTVSTVGIGDDFAKTALGLPAEFDITNRLFWSVWKEELSKLKEKTNDETKEANAKNTI